MKRLICFVILLFLSIAGVLAEESEKYTSGDYSYALLEDGTAAIITYFGTAETLVLPETLDGYPVSAIERSAFQANKNLISVTIPDCITDVDNPFIGCKKLKKIIVSPEHPVLATIDGVLFDKADKRLICYPYAFEQEKYSIPQGIAVIGDWAFSANPYLKEIIVPDSVVTVENQAFDVCEGLEEMLLPDSITSLGDRVFFCCSSLKRVKLPRQIESLQFLSFGNCSALMEVQLPDGLKSIEAFAFQECGALTSLILPEGLEFIGMSAFVDCYAMTSIAIPDSVTKVEGNPFLFTDVWEKQPFLKIIVSPDHPTLAVIDGVLFDKTDKRLISYFSEAEAESYAVPQGIRSVGERAFYGCDLKEIILPSSLMAIEESAFAYCDKLEEINIPSGVTVIGRNAIHYASDDLLVMVERNSYAAGWCKEQGIQYNYPDALDWLNAD